MTITQHRPAAFVQSRRLVEPALRAALGHLPASMERVAAYHFGWVDVDGHRADSDGGKAIRSAFVLACAGAVGGDATAAIPAACAVELAHNFSLLHDDVMDGDRIRRGRPTAWTIFGRWQAILAGDALLTTALSVLADLGPGQGPVATTRLAECMIELCEGQSADLAFEQRVQVNLDECTAMAQHKTGALFGCACALGALSAGALSELVTAFERFGRRLGMAFQLVDDLLGIWGDPMITGKPVYSDLAARKKSLPVVAALVSGTPAGDELAGLYGSARPLTTGQLARAADLVEEAGGRAWAQDLAQAEIESAITCIKRALFPRPLDAELISLARLISGRDH